MLTLKHLLTMLCFFLLLSCDPCGPDQTRNTTSDSSLPELMWEVEVGSRTAPGISTALSAYTADSTLIPISGMDSVRVRLVGRDPQSGIKMMDVEGERSFICMTDSTGTGSANQIPSAPENPPVSGSCAPVSYTFKEYVIAPANLCGPASNLSKGNWKFRGQAENHSGLIKASILQLEWTP